MLHIRNKKLLINLKNLSYPLEKITKKKPLNITSIDEDLFQSKYNDTLLKVDPVEVKNCYILPNGYLFKNFTLNKNQINLWIGNKNLFKLYIKSFFSIFGIRKSDRIKKGIFVTNSNSTNFFHWFLDVLQKLEFIEGISDFDLDIIVPYSHNEKYKINSLNAFNLKFYHQKKTKFYFLIKS